MDQTKIAVKQIDHIELFVPDRYKAAKWYEENLGLKILTPFEHWSEAKGGPLMISTASAHTKIALFEGDGQQSEPQRGIRRIAFLLPGNDFVSFLAAVSDLNLHDKNGRRISSLKPSDHGVAWSVYFCDPWGTRLEITTYDYDLVAEKLKA